MVRVFGDFFEFTDGFIRIGIILESMGKAMVDVVTYQSFAKEGNLRLDVLQHHFHINDFTLLLVVNLLRFGFDLDMLRLF